MGIRDHALKNLTFIFKTSCCMRKILLPLFLIIITGCTANLRKNPDWLIDPSPYKASVIEKNGNLEISNGLISRTFSIKPDGATISFMNLMTGTELLRAVKPEAAMKIDSADLVIGGLKGQPIGNYLAKEWISKLRADSLSPFILKGWKQMPITARFEWKKRAEWMPADIPWPPHGIQIDFTYVSKRNPTDRSVEIVIHYEIYDGLPLLCKWVTVNNLSDKDIRINSYKSEILALTEEESVVGDKKEWLLPNIYVETDYAYGGSTSYESCLDKSVFWVADPDYPTIINYNRIQPSMLVCKPVMGPDERLMPGKSFSTFRTWILVNDSWDRERKGLAQRKMYRTIAPWVTENPIFMHLRYSTDEAVKNAVDQCVATGFEKIILSFGSGFNVEDTSRANLDRYRQLAGYAHSKGIAIGGYSLLASRRIGEGNDVVMPEGKTPAFGNSPCLGSEWGLEYFAKLYRFFEYTGFDNLEHDGSYPGDVCMSVSHPGHEGLEDSQYKQYRIITDFYKWCRSRGIYLTVPDWYFLNGSSKSAMGYRETNWSLPRYQQEIIERQNIYDGTWDKSPSMGWMFVPLVEYQGGGAAATIEPLKDHLAHYGQRLANLFGAGVQAAYRGPRLYDTTTTLDLVRNWVTFYKKHRLILDSDIIHVRRPDGSSLDAILHVNPDAAEKGLLIVYNPLGNTVSTTMKVNVYYTGLDNKVSVTDNKGNEQVLTTERNYTISLPVTVEAHSQSWYIMK
jgi:hypothetical protein